MSKNVNTTSEDVRASVSSIYSDLLQKRKLERDLKEERKRLEKEERQKEKEEKKKDDAAKMSKKERRQAELDNWKEIIVGLTGDDLEYETPKKSKKKYRKWIDDDTDSGIAMVVKPKKEKKKNYNKEFEAELSMLRTLVADQNRFTSDLQKRYQVAAGPNTKDAMPLNKTLVELASVINNSRSNSLGVLKEIGNIKKTIADLYMKQKKMDADLGGGAGINTTDIGLMGSSIASSLFADDISGTPMSSPGVVSSYASPQQQMSVDINQQQAYPVQPQQQVVQQNVINPLQNQVSSFDPSSWDGPDIGENSSVMYEAIPHSVVVEWHKEQNMARFKAVRNDTGEELVGCPVPTSDPSKLTFNETDLTVKGEFDEMYKLEIV